MIQKVWRAVKLIQQERLLVLQYTSQSICANITNFTGHYSNIIVHEGNNLGVIQLTPNTLILTP